MWRFELLESKLKVSGSLRVMLVGEKVVLCCWPVVL